MSKFLKYIILVIIICLACIGTSSAWLAGYDYKQSCNLTGSTSWSSNLTSYQVKFQVFNTTGTSSSDVIYTNGHTLSSWDDLRFTNVTDGVFDYWIESTNATAAVVWIEIDSIYNSSSATQFHVYYGNSSASAASNGTNTFPFFDDFSGTSLDTTNKWTVDGATVTVADSVVTITYSSPAYKSIYTKDVFGQNVAVRALTKTKYFGTSSSIREYWGFMGGGNNIIFEATDGSPYGGTFYQYNGVGEYTGVSGYSANTWAIIDIIRNPSTSDFYVNGANKKSLTTGIPTNNMNIAAYVYNGGTNYFNWILIRKYTATEPTVSAWGSEQYNGWHNTSFAYRVPITISTPYNSTYQVLFNITQRSGMQSDFDDLRFVKTDNITLLDCWIENYTDSSYAWYWVEIPANDTTIWMYYGNSTCENVSNGTNTFPFFDDFPGSSVDTEKWTTSGSPAVSGGYCTIGGTVDETITSKSLYGRFYAIRSKHRMDAESAQYGYLGFIQKSLGRYASIETGSGANKARAYTTDGTAETTQVDYTPSYDVWDIIRTASSVIYNKSETTIATHSAQDPSDSLPVMIYDFTGTSENIIDWIFVHKYNATEPSISLGSSESLGCVASFTSNTTSGTAPLSVSFTDNSTGSITNWYWDVNGDNIADYTTQNCTHTYSAVGYYTVNLTVSDGASTNTTIMPSYITVTAGSSGTEGFLSGYDYRLTHNIANAAGSTLTNYPVRFYISNQSGINTNDTIYTNFHTLPSWNDIRFTHTNNTLLDYDIETTNATTATVWINATSIPTTGIPIYIYYGNSGASDASTTLTPSSNQTTHGSYGIEEYDTYLTDYDYRIAHNIGGSTSELTDYQIKFQIFNTSGVSSSDVVYTNGHTLPSWDDLRFTYTNNTLMDYWIESTNATAAIVWVEVPCIPVAGTPMYVYYGNSGASAASDGEDTFPFFDDFPGSSLDTDKWDVVAGTPSVSGGSITLAASGQETITTKSGYGANYAISTRASTPINKFAMIGFYQASLDAHRAWFYVDLNSDAQYGVQTQAGGSAQSTSIGNTYTGTRVWEVIRNSTTSVIFRVDGSTVSTHTSYVTTQTIKGTLFINDLGGTPNIVCDWFLVRKYAATEPTHSSYSVEQYSTSLTDYDYRLPHKIMGSTSNLDNYQMKFEIWNTSGININGTLYTNGHTLPSWDDLRFTYTNNTLMDYWIESTNATAAIVWVEVPCIPVAGTPMYIYYGNTGASAASNGDDTFVLFDDFNDGSWDTNKWDAGGSESGGELTSACSSKNTYGSGYAVRARSKSTGAGSNSRYMLQWANAVSMSSWIAYRTVDASGWAKEKCPSTVTTLLSAAADDNYHTLDIGILSTTAYFNRDGTNDGTLTSISSSANKVVNYVSDTDWDWVLVRKYTATEPYHLSQEIELLQTTGSPAPTAAFSANVTSGSTPLVVSFTDSSTGTPTAWWWDVDGDNTTDYFTQNCTHTYSVGGTYTVNLTTSNAYGTDSEIKIDYITASTGIIANFTGTPTSGIVPFTVQFNDTSTGGTATTWNWSFGDGALFNTTDPTLSNATHDYLTPGIYSVNLSINDTTSSDYEFKSTYITAENIRVNFTYNVSVGIPPFVVQFNITDPYGTIDNWSWDVQNDGFADYFTPNCTHTYDAVGLFSVNLSINNTATQNFTLHENIIQSGNVPIVNFTASTTDGAAPLVVTFTDNTSGNATAWAWDLTGDGVIDNTTQNASYRYTTSGYYTIRHRANNTFGLAWENKTDYIFVGAPPVANFVNHTTTLRNTSPGSSVIFNYTGNGTEPLSFEWDVNGDGSTDYTTRNVSHTYATQGTYSVNMRSYSAYGSDWENKTGYILVGTAPTGAFTSNVTSGVVSFAVNFINQTTGYPTPSYAWDIDNSGSTDYTTASPNHTYTAVKNYSVKLTITNTFGSNTTTITDYIVAGTTPISNFTVSARNGTLPFTVNFYANMTGWPNASYSWDLTGDGVTDATGRNTTHTYTTAGLYTINLTTTNMFGTNVTSRTDYIAAGMEPKIKFSAHPLTGTNILTTTFTDLTGGLPTIWNWSFGDGEYNETQNPVHYYGTVGDFNVSLNATNAYGYNSTTYYYYIVVSGEPISTVIFTYPATNVTSSSVSMCGGIVANYTDDVWFEYGLTPSALTFSTRETRNLSGESNFTSNMSGSTLYGGSTYYYRAASEDYGKGVVRSFTVPTPSPDIADETVPQAFETELDRFERFDDADFDFMAMAPIVAEVYTSVWGFWIYGLIWAGVFGAFFLRHEDITIPTFLYVLFSFTISSYLPASWMPFIYVSVAVCLAAIVYTLYRGVRNG